MPIGLIRWKIVIHAFIDGKTRLVVGIQANNNNRAATVLALFLNCISVHGTPSRVRGDHGTENVEVAKWMEENRGSGRGSYIWGRLCQNHSADDTVLARAKGPCLERENWRPPSHPERRKKREEIRG